MKNKLITDLYNNEKLNQAINNITKGDPLAEDLKSELFYILCGMPYEKLQAAEEDGYLLFLCINILKKQYNSSTSPFHKKYRTKTSELVYEVEDDVDTSYLDYEAEVIQEINKFLETLAYTDRELFKIYYKMGEYDRWIGSKRDTNCTKNISSSRKIERKLAIQSIKGQKRVTIDHSTIALSVKNTLEKLKKHFETLEL